MATIIEIQNLWEQDCIISNEHLDEESIKSAKLHAKYIAILMDTKLRISKMRVDLSSLRKNKFRYYRGELSRQELTDLGWSQWQYAKPLKNEMDQLLDGDSDISLLRIKMEYLEASLYLLESIMKSIADRTWSIGNSIKFKAFLAGC
jgi:hypothetical protein